ncbi:unnamed protein product, partial [Ectocarpus sp. 12 AP-2014]
ERRRQWERIVGSSFAPCTTALPQTTKSTQAYNGADGPRGTGCPL